MYTLKNAILKMHLDVQNSSPLANEQHFLNVIYIVLSECDWAGDCRLRSANQLVITWLRSEPFIILMNLGRLIMHRCMGKGYIKPQIEQSSSKMLIKKCYD